MIRGRCKGGQFVSEVQMQVPRAERQAQAREQLPVLTEGHGNVLAQFARERRRDPLTLLRYKRKCAGHGNPDVPGCGGGP